jgi:L-lysine exporter family protein LysE/ArgO
MVNVAMIHTGLKSGIKPAFLLGVGSSFGDLCYAGTSAIGLAFVLNYVAIRWILWIGGTTVLAYLAFNMVKESITGGNGVSGTAHDQAVELTVTSSKELLRGFWLAVSSPSSILWFAAVGGSVIAASAGNSYRSLALFFSGFFLGGMVWSLFIAILSSKGGKFIGPKLRQYCCLISGLLFVYFTFKVAIEGYHPLL